MITDNYIKMCEQAEEMQKSNIDIGKRHFSNQDFVAYNCGEGLKVYVCSEISRYWLIDDLIWLPTQEQLQEIIFGEYTGIQTITSAIEQFSKSKTGCDISIIGEMNELWLAFVMYEKWGKVWLKDRWVKNEDR